MRVFAAVLAAAGLAAVSATTFVSEGFEGAYADRWTVGSEWKDGLGEWKQVTPKYHTEGKGLKTGEDARFYSLSAPLDAEVSTAGGKDLVISYSVKHEQNLDCGGAYIKLLPPGFDQAKFGGDTEYAVMFGPDVCGTSTRKTHVILTHNGKNLQSKKNVKAETDNLTHRYTLIVSPDNTYEVRVDGEKVEGGDLLEDFDFPAEQIKDPEQSKPEDWVDQAKIADPEDVKPDGWDAIPATIPDPEAEQPDDWDEDEDGEWEAPQVENPEYKGEWKPKMIDNPDYKGPWVHPLIDNAEYDADPFKSLCNPCSHVGFELWQVKAGTVFDDILVTDSVEEAEAFDATIADKIAAEKEAHDAEKEAERKKAEEARKAADEAAEAAKAAEAEEEEEEDLDEEDEDEDHEDL